jgi:hypothetical protein
MPTRSRLLITGQGPPQPLSHGMPPISDPHYSCHCEGFKKCRALSSPVSFSCTAFLPPPGCTWSHHRSPPPLVYVGAEVHRRQCQSQSRHHYNCPLSVSSLHHSPPLRFQGTSPLSSLPRSFRCPPPTRTTIVAMEHRCAAPFPTSPVLHRYGESHPPSPCLADSSSNAGALPVAAPFFLPPMGRCWPHHRGGHGRDDRTPPCVSR